LFKYASITLLTTLYQHHNNSFLKISASLHQIGFPEPKFVFLHIVEKVEKDFFGGNSPATEIARQICKVDVVTFVRRDYADHVLQYDVVVIQHVTERILLRKNGGHHVVIEFLVKECFRPSAVFDAELKGRKHNVLKHALEAHNGKWVKSVHPIHDSL